MPDQRDVRAGAVAPSAGWSARARTNFGARCVFLNLGFVKLFFCSWQKEPILGETDAKFGDGLLRAERHATLHIFFYTGYS